MILQSKVGDLNTGEPDFDQFIETGYVSWPREGKHLSFDGSLLHGAPADIMPVGEFERQCCSDIATTTCEVNTDEGGQQEHKVLRNKLQRLQRNHRRMTFLVNIWLNHCPLGIQPFPKDKIGLLSPLDAIDNDLAVSVTKEDDCKTTVLVRGTSQRHEANDVASTSPIKHFTWTLGWPVSIKADLPIHTIMNEMGSGGNLCINWKEKGMVSFAVLNA